MDDTEQRLANALKARAALVTEDSLRVDHQENWTERQVQRARGRRWAWLGVATALAATLSIALAALPGAVRDVPPPDLPMFPANSACRDLQCHLVQRVSAAGDPIEVWASPEGSTWEVRVRDLIVATNAEGGGTVVSNPLRCWTLATRPYCLVQLATNGQQTNWVGVTRSGRTWTSSIMAYTYSSIGGIDVRDLGVDDTVYLVIVRFTPGSTKAPSGWLTQVWRWDGSLVGCSEPTRDQQSQVGPPDLRDLANDCPT